MNAIHSLVAAFAMTANLPALQDPPGEVPEYVSDQGFMTEVEAKFNDLIGNTPDAQGNLPPEWVKIEGTNSSPPSGVREWEVIWKTTNQKGKLASTQTMLFQNPPNSGNYYKTTDTTLYYNQATVFLDPPTTDPRLPSGVDPWAEFWSVILWHEWNHSVQADPTEVGRPAGTPHVSQPDFADDHLDLKRRELDIACGRVCALIAAEQTPGQFCKGIHLLCKYIRAQQEGFNSPGFHDLIQGISSGFQPVDPGPPPVYYAGCLCCATYNLTLCGIDFDGASFVDNSFGN